MRMKVTISAILILCMCSGAYAGLVVGIDVPVGPDGDATLSMGSSAILSIEGDGLTVGWQSLMLVVRGGGSIQGGEISYSGSDSSYMDLEQVSEVTGESSDALREAVGLSLGVDDVSDLSYIDLYDSATPPAALEGVLVTKINYLCTGFGDARLVLVDLDDNVLDEKLVHQIPEPATISLLLTGALTLFASCRRRQRL